MSSRLHAECLCLADNFTECPDEVVKRIKTSLLEHHCAPENRLRTEVALHPPFRLGTSVVVSVRYTRNEGTVTLKCVVDEEGTIHTFPYSPSDDSANDDNGDGDPDGNPDGNSDVDDV